MHDEAAHPSAPFNSPVKQLGEFFKRNVKDWVNSINQKGFISLQVTASFTFFSTFISLGEDVSNPSWWTSMRLDS
jgi:hypothetical protein